MIGTSVASTTSPPCSRLSFFFIKLPSVSSTFGCTSCSAGTATARWSDVACDPNGSAAVHVDDTGLYASLFEFLRWSSSSLQVRALHEGLADVLPVAVFPLFSAAELELFVCGERMRRGSAAVQLLRRCTEFEGVDAAAPHIAWLWEVLEELMDDDLERFLVFVWARARLPHSEAELRRQGAKLRLKPATGPAAATPDAYLPTAQTCFFTLQLPVYTSKAILKEKLLLAIRCSPTMDADVRLHTAEGWEH